jgi:putative ABC transport system permease protein
MATFIFKNLSRRKTRTLLTVLGIAVGVAMIVALGAVAEGFRVGYLAMFSGSGADLIMLQKGSYEISLSAIDEDIVNQVRALLEVNAATGMMVGYISAPGLLRFNVFGYDLDGFAIKRYGVIEGQSLDSARSTSTGGVLLGKKASEAIKAAVGKSVRLLGSTFRVAGIYETGSGFDDGGRYWRWPMRSACCKGSGR